MVVVVVVEVVVIVIIVVQSHYELASSKTVFYELFDIVGSRSVYSYVNKVLLSLTYLISEHYDSFLKKSLSFTNSSASSENPKEI